MAIDPKDNLVKANVSVAATSDNRRAWQEPFERYQTVPASKASQAPEILKNFVGSWAGQWALESLGSRVGQPGVGSAAGVQIKRNRLGHDGDPEINFRPYDVNTLMRGRNGPSLLGHPVSFQFVGPTLKGQNISLPSNLDFQWSLTEGPANDVLTIDTLAFSHTAATPAAPTYSTIEEIYGLTALPFEGLYMVVLETGSAGELVTQASVAVAGGVGDGKISSGRQAVVPKYTTSKYEIYRVVDMSADSFTLDSKKRIRDHFEIPATPVIRAIALIRPYAARLIPVPGANRKVYAFLPPKTTLIGDFWPMATEYTLGNRLSAAHFFSEEAGNPNDYQREIPIPVPYSKDHFRASLPDAIRAGVASDLGRFVVWAVPNQRIPSVEDIGKILRIKQVDPAIDMVQWDASGIGGQREDPGVDRLLGDFLVLNVNVSTPGSEFWVVLSTASWDMEAGFLHWPAAADTFFESLSKVNPAAEQRAYVDCSIHETIENLWQRSYLHPEILNTARLTNIIDPAWAGMSAKSWEGGFPGTNLSRADKAIFDTSSSLDGSDGSNADPGSLLDLGFRPVFFPATKNPGSPVTWIPDFNNPIDTRGEIVLDPAVDEDQWIRIDYSAGLVYLSHTPALGSGLFPDLTLDNPETDNARGEPFFFASFVPFSKEPGQFGVNPRVTGEPVDADCTLGAGSADVYGEKKSYPLYPQTLTEQGTATADPSRFEIILEHVAEGWDIPMSGWVTLVQGRGPNGMPVFVDADGNEVSTFRYEGFESRNISGNQYVTVLLNISGSGQIGHGGYTVDTATPASAVWRRDIQTPNTYDGDHGTDYRQDMTMGYAARASAMRFEGAEVRRLADGSVNVNVKDPRVDQHTELFSDLFSSWVLDGASLSSGLANEVTISSGTVLMKGRRIEFGSTNFGDSTTLPNGFDGYVYLDSTVDLCGCHPATTTTLPLPDPDDILLARVSVDGLGVVSVDYDLRRPLLDLDKRQVITVGNVAGHPQPSSTHFSTLIEAIEYVNQIMAAGSRDGQQYIIRVIAGTVEDKSKLPYTLPEVDGLIIEGAATRTGPGSYLYNTITWSGTNASLFQSGPNSGKRYHFRNLVFIYDSGSLGVSTVPEERNLFHIQDYVTEWVWENVTFNSVSGDAHGFIYGNVVAGSTGLQRCIIRNCDAEVTDYGVMIEHSGGGEQFSECLVEHNLFSLSGKVTTVTNCGGIWIPEDGSSGSVCRDNKIVGNKIADNPQFGIVTGGTEDVIQANLIEKTVEAGIWVFGAGAYRASILDNHLVDVHTGVPIAFGKKTGIGITSGPTNAHIIRGNSITLSTPAVGDRSIDGTGATELVISENFCDYNLVFGANSRVTDNVVDGELGTAATGDYSLIKGNIIAGDAWPAAGAMFTGNMCGSIVHPVSSSSTSVTVVANNFLGYSGPYHGSGGYAVYEGNFISAGLQLASNMKISNNVINSGGNPPIYTPSLTEWVTIAGNTILTTADFSFRSDHMTFTGNAFLSAIEVDFDDSDYANVVGNSFRGGCVLSSTTSTASYSHFEGNVCQVGMSLRGSKLRVLGNYVEGVVSGSTYSMEVTGHESVIDGNTSSGGLHVGAQGNSDACVVNGNFLDGTLIIGDVAPYTSNETTVSDNFVDGSVSVLSSLRVSLRDNAIIGDVDATGRDETLVAGNLIRGATGLTLTGQRCQCVGNYLDNVANKTKVSLGTSGMFVGNYVGGDDSGAGTGTCLDTTSKSNTFIVGNHFVAGAALVTAGSTTFSNNYMGGGGALTFSGTGSLNVVNGNIIGGITSLTGADTSFVGNVLGDTVNATGDDMVIAGNRGDVALNSTGNRVIVDGNHLDYVNINAGVDTVVANNRANYSMLVATDGSAVEGNRVVATLTVSGGGCTISGNVVGSHLVCTGLNPTITGNQMAGDLAVNKPGYVIVGNRIGLIVEDTVGGGGPDPDPAAGIFVANRVANGGASGTPFFGGAMPASAGGLKDNNI